MQRVVTFVIAAICVASAVCADEPKPKVSFEIVTQPGIPPTATQQWYQALTDLKIAGLRIRTGAEGDKPQVKRQGTAARRCTR